MKVKCRHMPCVDENIIIFNGNDHDKELKISMILENITSKK